MPAWEKNPLRTIDKTHLSIDKAEERGLIHRDYIAHCFRWTHVVRQVAKKHQSARILDIGCGKEFPLAKSLYVNKMSPAAFLGIDANQLSRPAIFDGKEWFHHIEGVDVCEVPAEVIHGVMGGPPTVITCFEVLEHVQPAHARRMLKHFLAISGDDTQFFFSTPCFNGSAAQNHVNEMKYEAFGGLLEDLGFGITAHYGTFASIRDYESLLDEHQRAVFEQMRAYYDTNVLAVMFAPMFPHASRNCIWCCSKTKRSSRQFPRLVDVEPPWGQNQNWEMLAQDDLFQTSSTSPCPDQTSE